MLFVLVSRDHDTSRMFNTNIDFYTEIIVPLDQDYELGRLAYGPGRPSIQASRPRVWVR